ncbi:MAG: transglutaminase-like domain-containing protein [Armatimonadia bacterium]
MRHLLLLALLALAGGPALGADGPVALPEAVFGTHWYTVTILGARSGYSCQTLSRIPGGVESLERTVLRVRMGDQTLTAERSERRRYDPALRLLEIEHQANQIGRRMTVRAIRRDGSLQVTRLDPEGERHSELPVPNDFGGELEVLQVLASGQMRAGWQKTLTTFDADLGKLDQLLLRAENSVTEPQAGWLLTGHSKLLDLPTKMWISDEGVLLRQEVPGMMNMTLELATEEEALADLTPALLSSDIPVTGQQPTATRLKQIRLRATAPAGSLQDAVPATRRQTVSVEGNGLLVDTVAEEPPLSSVQLPVKLPELQEYLRPTDLAQCADPGLVKQARQIIGPERNAWEAARKLTMWVYHKLNKVQSEPRPVSALEIVKMNSGDCTEHAILLAALAQAVGLPARVAAGLVYDGGAYHYHAWNELYVGRWVEMDATWGQETVDAGHLQLAHAALDSAALARLSLASARTMGNLNIEVIDYQ